MHITPTFLDQALRLALGDPPRVSGEVASIELVQGWDHVGPGSWEDEAGNLFATARLITWDEDGGTISIRDIKEQQLRLIRAAHRKEGERLQAALEGWAIAVVPILGSLGRLETLMPHDLLSLDVLGLKRPKTPDDFARAFNAKRRLGRWM